MPKSKEFISDSESGSESGSDVEPKPKKTKVEKVEKKEEKKAEPQKNTKGPNGETMIELSGMKFATVGEFKGKVLIGIREYYNKDGKILPGKKGIALNADQWKKLKENIDDVDAAIKEMS